MPVSTLASAAPRPLELLLRATLAYACALWLASRFGRDLVDMLLPAFRTVFLALDDHYRILGLAIGNEGADTVLRLRVTLARPVLLGGRVIFPDPRGIADATHAIGHILLPALIALAAALAWPARRAVELVVRLLFTLVLLTPVLLIDTPCILLASIWGMQVDSIEPGRFSPLLLCEAFLQGGGRAALGATVAVLAVSGAAAFGRRLSG